MPQTGPESIGAISIKTRALNVRFASNHDLAGAFSRLFSEVSGCWRVFAAIRRGQTRARFRLPANDRMPPLTRRRITRMHAYTWRAARLMVLAVSLGLAECALIDELKDTVSKMVGQDEHEGGVPVATKDSLLSMKTPGEEANKASTEKGPLARKLHGQHTVKLPSKPPTSGPAEQVTPKEPAAQSAPSQSAPSRLPSPWPEPPSAGSFEQ